MKSDVPVVPLSGNPGAAATQTLTAILGHGEWVAEANALASGLASASPTAVATSMGRAIVVLEALWHRTVCDTAAAPLHLRPALLKSALAIRAELRSSLEALESHQRRHMPAATPAALAIKT